MSGPKLSAYELEQLRKAELERIQREIAASHANILRIHKEVKIEKEWCMQELAQIERQLTLVENCSLSQNECSQTKRAILSEKRCVLNLLSSLENIKVVELGQPEELTEVQAEERRLRELFDNAIASKTAMLSDRSEYETLLERLSADLKNSLNSTTLSLSEAMQSVRSNRHETAGKTTEMTALKVELLDEIDRLRSDPMASGEEIERLDMIAHFVTDTMDSMSLNEVRSVAKDLAYKYAKLKSMRSEYIDVLCQHNALLLRMGELPVEEETFDNVRQMAERIAELKKENISLQKLVVAVAERKEVTKAIDDAMKSLGYDLIGTKGASAEGCIKLYQFAKGTGIQMIQRADGTVRLKVVGLSDSKRDPKEAEKEHLLHMQEEFCSTYEQIQEAFLRHGVKRVRGTEKKLPPDVQFSEIVSIKEYDPDYATKKKASDKASKKKRVSVYEPKHMSSGY